MALKLKEILEMDSRALPARGVDLPICLPHLSDFQLWFMIFRIKQGSLKLMTILAIIPVP